MQVKHLFPIAIVGGVLYLLLWPLHPYPLSYALKAVPVLLLALMAQSLLQGRERWLYTLAMVSSAAGDIFLDLDRTAFLRQALFSFLITQLAYIALFWPLRQAVKGRVVRMALPAVFAGLLLWQFYPNTGALWWPVVVYVFCLCGMAVLGLLSGNHWIAVGGLLFMLADSLIGVNRFWLPFEHSTPIIVSIYLTGQLLLGYGVLLARQRLPAA